MSFEQRHRDLVSGQARGPVAALTRAGLSTLALAYSAVLHARGLTYRLIPSLTHRVAVPVISVGNLTTGGTGKTPMTAWVASRLLEAGRRPAILTRGYKGKPPRHDASQPQSAQSQWRIESDEAEVLRRHCPGASVIIQPDRLAGARRALQNGCDCLVLDDGFQHRRLARDIDIVLIDATCPFGFGRLLPRGLLREPRSALRRASLIVITRADQVDAAQLESLAAELSRIAPDRPILRCRHHVADFCDLRGRPLNGVDPAATQAVIFAGIANFAAFRATVERLGVRVLAAHAFPDHHDYTDAEIRELPQIAAGLEANALLTTEKDAVKLVGRWPDDAGPLFVPRVRIAFEGDGERVLGERLTQALQSARPA